MILNIGKLAILTCVGDRPVGASLERVWFALGAPPAELSHDPGSKKLRRMFNIDQSGAQLRVDNRASGWGRNGGYSLPDKTRESRTSLACPGLTSRRCCGDASLAFPAFSSFFVRIADR